MTALNDITGENEYKGKAEKKKEKNTSNRNPF